MLPEDGSEAPDKSPVEPNRYSRLEPFVESSNLDFLINSSTLKEPDIPANRKQKQVILAKTEEKPEEPMKYTLLDPPIEFLPLEPIIESSPLKQMIESSLQEPMIESSPIIESSPLIESSPILE